MTQKTMLARAAAPAKSAAKPRSRSGQIEFGTRADDATNTVFVKAFLFEPLEQVQVIKQGVPAQMVVTVAKRMGITKERLFTTLGLPRATVDRKVREKKTLSQDESSRVLGISRLVGQAQAMVVESGDPIGFNAAEWVAGWLDQPVSALGGRRPAELMDTAEGQAIVANLLERAQTGAYS